MTSTTEPRPDTTEMVVVHDVLRDTLSAAPSLIGAVAPDDADRVELLKNLYANVLAFLTVHHEGEDELIYPLLLDRAPEQRDLIARVNAQHHEVEELIASTGAAVRAWAPGDAGAQETAAAALRELDERLAVHLQDEEQEMLPLCAEHVSVAEWGALPGHAMQHFGGDKIWLVLGLIRERMTQEQRDLMLAKMPPPAVEMWTGFGERAFGELMRQVGPPLG